MNETPIDQPPLPRVGRNIPELSMKILLIANPVLVESNLPNFSAKLFTHLMREPALDALRTSFNGLVLRRCQQHVQMFRHHNESMQSVSSLIPIMKERLDQQLGILRPYEQSAP